MAVTILDVAEAKLGREARTGADFAEVGLPMMGGCERCGATVAAYNACPSQTGYIRCLSECIADLGFDTAEAALKFLFEEGPPEPSPDDRLAQAITAEAAAKAALEAMEREWGRSRDRSWSKWEKVFEAEQGFRAAQRDVRQARAEVENAALDPTDPFCGVQISRSYPEGV
jgi:hypothetical protein